MTVDCEGCGGEGVWHPAPLPTDRGGLGMDRPDAVNHDAHAPLVVYAEVANEHRGAITRARELVAIGERGNAMAVALVSIDEAMRNLTDDR